MAKSILQTAASMAMRVKYDTGDSKIIGLVGNFGYSVNNGQKSTFGVDSQFPVEIAQSASPSQVKGQFDLFLPKGYTPESIGLVPYRTDIDGSNIAAASNYMTIEMIDRTTQKVVFSCAYAKVGNYSLSVQAKGIVRATCQFDGILLNPNL